MALASFCFGFLVVMDANDIITVKLHIAHMEGLMMPFMAEITSLAETVLFRLEFE